jgi:4-alpha-glucanotransferase
MRWIHLDVNVIRLSHVKYIFQLWIEPDSENDTKSEYVFINVRVMCMLIDNHSKRHIYPANTNQNIIDHHG